MTVVGGGGVVIKKIRRSKKFDKRYSKLSGELAERVDDTLKKLMQNPMPPGIRFEKLKGYDDPCIYTVHVTGNYKISMSIEGSTADLRNVGPHDLIDSAP